MVENDTDNVEFILSNNDLKIDFIFDIRLKKHNKEGEIMDKFIITLTAKYLRLEGVTIEEAITQIKEGIEEICGEIFEVEVKKSV